MVNVSWHDAQAYVAWLGEQSGGWAYRLLSEAEWEYCCRAGTTSQYSAGDRITAKQANFGRKVRGTTSVFKFASNLWGFRDMHGNVWEWCEDNWHPSYDGAPPDGSVRTEGDMSLRVLRGGSWYSIPQDLRSAYRYRYRRDIRSYGSAFELPERFNSFSFALYVVNATTQPSTQPRAKGVRLALSGRPPLRQPQQQFWFPVNACTLIC